MIETIPALFERTVEKTPSKAWLTFEDDVYTYQQAHEHINAAASEFQQLGVGRTSRVVGTTKNSPEYLFAWLALMRLGAVLVPVNPKSSVMELSALIDQVDPVIVLSDTGLEETVVRALSRSPSRAQVVPVEQLPKIVSQRVHIAALPDEIAVMIPTSGTTGRSKLVMQTQRAYAMAGEGFPFWLGLTSDDRLMTSLPLFHINAPAYSVLGSVAAGASLILLPRFSGRSFIDSARRYGATEFNAIGAMLEILMRQPRRDDDSDNPLRICYTGPSPTRERQLEIERRFGFEIVCGYALSETPYGLVWKRGTRPFGTLGSLRQHPTLGEINHARVMNDGCPVSAGEVGELELKNPAVMAGYYGMPEETEKVLRDGWLRTGDLVRVNRDGTYTFVVRKKELIRRRGENLSPVEVEAVLESHADVAEAAVIGVPSELSEEEVKAFVVLVEDAAISLDQLYEFATTRLAAFKVPRYLEVVDRLPHTPTGRLAKHKLPIERTDGERDFDPRPAVTD
jgi:crotonobetaine/carnitine-CoA ligase